MECETFQHQALEVRMPDASFDPTIQPQDGEEYLTKMVYERNNCPAVVVAANPPKRNTKTTENSNKDIPEIVFSNEIIDTSPACLHPTPEWKQAQLTDFEMLRQKIVNLRLKLAKNGFNSADNIYMPLSNDRDTWKTFCQNNQPLLSIVLRIDQKSLERLLAYEKNWLQYECIDSGSGSVHGPDHNDDDEPLAAVDLTKAEIWLGSWIYSTLACLHMPLEPMCHSLLRDIAKACIALRNQLNPDDIQRVIPLNLFILIISKTFSQLDLFEYV